MNIFKLLIAVVFLALIGGFAYFSFVDVPVQQQETVKNIPNSRFFSE